MIRTSWRLLAVLVLLGISPGPAAKEARYSVEITAPDPIREFLYNHLDIVKAAQKAETKPANFRTLYREAPAQFKTLLATEGYFRPEVKPYWQRSEQQFQARFEVKLNNQAKVSGVDLQFLGDVTKLPASASASVQHLRTQWTLPTGAVFNQAAWEQAKRELLRALLAERFPTAQFAKTLAEVQAQNDSVNLAVVVNSGPEVTLGELEISGLQRYDKSIVRNLNTIKPGEVYSLAKLQDLQRRLQNTLYFSYVSVTADARRTSPTQVPIKVAVTETQSKRLGLGFGLNTDTGVRGQIEFNNHNFLNRGWRFSSLLRTEAARQLINAALDYPPTQEGYRYGLNAALLRTTVQQLDTTTLSIGGRRSILEDDIEKSIGVEYLWEHVNESGLLQDDNLALYPSIVWNKRNFDNLLDPTRGYALTLQLGGGLKSVLSKQDFLRMHGKWIGYFSPTAKDQIIMLADVGVVLADSQRGIPNVLLFRTGGDQSVRGYAFQSLGLRRGDAIVGARYLTVGSIEYVHWLTPSWGAATFCDVGDAFDTFADYQANLGFGVGARWRSPVGPVYLDLAYGEASEQVRLHFALGIRF